MNTLKIILIVAFVTATGCRRGADVGQTGVKPGSDPHQHPSTATATERASA